MSGFQDIVIENWVKKYQIQNFVETGCHTGEGLVHAARNGIPHLYSCDIIPKYVELCRSRVPQASLFEGHSVDFLEQILDFLRGPSFFWLDAHFPDLYGADNLEEFRFPLLQELELISRKANVEKDVILIDDIRVFQDEKNPLKQTEFDEKYKIYDYPVANLVALFPKHDYHFINFQEGLLLFLPK